MNAPVKMSKTLHIGAMLADRGRLTEDQVARILQHQKAQRLRFGESAVALGYVSQDDVAAVLAEQFDYPYLQKGEGGLADELIAAHAPFSPEVEKLRALRGQLMLRWLDKTASTNALAIVSADAGAGRSWLAANLAIVFSQLGEHTLLVDADLRNPRQHKLFGLDNREGLSQLLAERATESSLSRVPKFRDLTVLTAGPMPPNPQELICCSTFQALLNQWQQQYDVVLIDTPALGDTVDAQSVAGRTGGVLAVVRQDHTRHDALAGMQEMLAAADARIVGAVVNRF